MQIQQKSSVCPSYRGTEERFFWLVNWGYETMYECLKKQVSAHHVGVYSITHTKLKKNEN